MSKLKESISKLLLLLAGIVVVIIGSSIFLVTMVSLYEMLRGFFEKFASILLGG